MSKKILDIGASDNPDKRATHAVDESLTPKEIKKAEGKSKKLEEYYEGDFRFPPKEMKHKFDVVVSHFAPSALMGKSASKALDYVTKEDATAEIETDMVNVTKIVQTLHDANFKVLSVEAKTIPSVTPALGGVSARVIIKAIKKRKQEDKSYYPMPIRIRLPNKKTSKKRRIIKHHKQTKPISLGTATVS